jgi:hypothetical protein
MINRLFLVAALLVPHLAYGGNPSANFSLQIAPAASTPAVPAAAQAAGFTTLAANYDFTQPLPANWLGCNPWDGQKHQWNQTSPVPCDVAQVFDSAAGSNVLRLGWQPSYGNDLLELSTIKPDLSGPTADFPNAYFEVVFRTQTTPDVPAPAYEASGGVTAFWTFTLSGGYEIDTPEHWFQFCADTAVHDWPGGNNTIFLYNPTYPCNYDPRQYHTWGTRFTADGVNGIGACTYLDGVLIKCGTLQYHGTDATARHYLILWNGVGCNFARGVSSCMNAAITNVYNCGGNVCITVPAVPTNGSNYPTFGAATANIAGVGGVQGANGAFTIAPNGSDWRLNGSTFSGSYTGGGTLNPYTRLDTYVKSVRVWSCANWATTMCNGSLLTGAP